MMLQKLFPFAKMAEKHGVVLIDPNSDDLT